MLDERLFAALKNGVVKPIPYKNRNRRSAKQLIPLSFAAADCLIFQIGAT